METSENMSDSNIKGTGPGAAVPASLPGRACGAQERLGIHPRV